MNFDRSAVSLRLYMEKIPYIMLTKLTCILRLTSTFLYMSLSKKKLPPGWGHFRPQGHNLNRPGRGSLDDATRVIFYVRRIGLYLYKYRIYGTRLYIF